MATTLCSAEPIAAVLKAARVARGMTQRELASLAGVTQAHLAHIEAGKVDVRISSLTQLARSLDLELVIVPRARLPVVESVRQLSPRGPPGAPESVSGRDLRRILNQLKALRKRAATQPALAATLGQIAANLQQLGSVNALPWHAVRPLERKLARLRRSETLAPEKLRGIIDDVAQLRRAAAKRENLRSEPQELQGAYSLEYAQEE